jgi:hypothetical protein
MKIRSHRHQIPWRLPASLTRSDIGLSLVFFGAAFVICLAAWLAIDAISSADRIGTGIEQFAQNHPVVVKDSAETDIVLSRVLFAAVIALSVVGAYQLFMSFCSSLDQTGHWNRVVSRRKHKHH